MGQQIAQESLSELSIEQVEDTFESILLACSESVKAAEKYLPAGSTIITTTSVQATNPSISHGLAATKKGDYRILQSI